MVGISASLDLSEKDALDKLRKRLARCQLSIHRKLRRRLSGRSGCKILPFDSEERCSACRESYKMWFDLCEEIKEASLLQMRSCRECEESLFESPDRCDACRNSYTLWRTLHIQMYESPQKAAG